MFLLAYALVLFCIIFSTLQILKLANERKFRDFEFEKLALDLVGPKFSIFIEILLFCSQMSVFIAGILFTGLFKSRVRGFYFLQQSRIDPILSLKGQLYFYRPLHFANSEFNQQHESVRICFFILQFIYATHWYF